VAKKGDTSAIERNIKRKIKAFKLDNKQMQKVAKIIRNEIIEDTLRYKTFEGKDVKNASITTKWLNRKMQLTKSGVTPHSKASGSNKSNMVFTGRLLRSLISIVKGNKIELSFDGDHKPYKNGETIENSEIYGHLLKQGFNKVLGVSSSAKKRIANQFRQFLRRKN